VSFMHPDEGTGMKGSRPLDAAGDVAGDAACVRRKGLVPGARYDWVLGVCSFGTVVVGGQILLHHGCAAPSDRFSISGRAHRRPNCVGGQPSSVLHPYHAASVPDGSGPDGLGAACDRHLCRASQHRLDAAVHPPVPAGLVGEAELLHGISTRGGSACSPGPESDSTLRHECRRVGVDG
jgi:hypothetical protein